MLHGAFAFTRVRFVGRSILPTGRTVDLFEVSFYDREEASRVALKSPNDAVYINRP